MPHRLYGFLAGADVASAGRWLGWVVPEIEAAWAAGKVPIICGGTGLYLQALMQGISPMPEVPEAVRAGGRCSGWRRWARRRITPELAAIDALSAERIGPHNSQRLVRAREVWEASGRRFSEWVDAPRQLVLPEAEFKSVRW